MMSKEPKALNRREAMVGVLTASAIVSLTLTPSLTAANVTDAATDAEFTPENDYPYFDYVPDPS